ncbi:hypothetical protein BDY21DRAFT_374763 [Lineolata rhizophorae]|uniref:Bacterial low temperature requirement A protein-domain-containing protein n=1 Tax=Lineolata rhizophorae TaxID=578093 RepID=A0A6A6NP15_9PEZI|nr:hypothetical protein BDY21DRAFT_374763 [Lineolata rhizophorae]
MGLLPHLKSKDPERSKRRKHKILPFLESPLKGADLETQVFSQRHEANTVELFFDLFFVANLATFTAYHGITDHESLLAYIGFFVFLWATWFQITLHDVRFARDSVYERVCKLLQFVVFVGFALVGSKFAPGTEKASIKNFRILCYVIFLSRIVLAIQYFVVLIYAITAKFSRLYVPLALNAAAFLAVGIVFIGVTAAFEKDEGTPNGGLFALWYILLAFETATTIGISVYWRILSFKKTHLVERMGLLTLIVIGEGAIGVTKTVTRLMGKEGLYSEGVGLTICIIIVLVYLWALYFDNHPHGHYGTIRQQFWAVLHFPFHLAIVGVVEGCQQVAAAWYLGKAAEKINKELVDICLTQQLDGTDLTGALAELVDYWELDKKAATLWALNAISTYLTDIEGMQGICTDISASDVANKVLPQALLEILAVLVSAIYEGMGIILPQTDLPFAYMLNSWRVIFFYFWGAVALVILCYFIFLQLIRKNKADLFDWISSLTRLGVIGLCIAIIIIGIADEEFHVNFITSPWMIPATIAMFTVIAIGDFGSRKLSNYLLKKRGYPIATDDPDEHGHGAAHTHSVSHSGSFGGQQHYSYDHKAGVGIQERPISRPREFSDASYPLIPQPFGHATPTPPPMGPSVAPSPRTGSMHTVTSPPESYPPGSHGTGQYGYGGY